MKPVSLFCEPPDLQTRPVAPLTPYMANTAFELERLLLAAHARMDQARDRYYHRAELHRLPRLSWDEWRSIPAFRPSCIDGRPL